MVEEGSIQIGKNYKMPLHLSTRCIIIKHFLQKIGYHIPTAVATSKCLKVRSV